jgi:peptide/nickel transport system permease protein
MSSWCIFIVALLLILSPISLLKSPLLNRFFSLLAVVIGATMVVSLGMRLAPGDPVHYVLGDQALEASKDSLAKELRLRDLSGKELSFVEQYSSFIKGLLRNDLKSFVSGKNTFSAAWEKLPYTVALALGAMLVALVFGTLFGIFAAAFFHRWPDHLLSIFALIGISLPSFFLAPLLLIFFSLTLKLLPISGAEDGILSLILPSLSLGIALAAMLARLIRASLLEVLSEDYIRTALAKGLRPRDIVIKHALRNALVPIVTIFGLQCGTVLCGTVITEKIFNWPGLGLLLLDSIYRFDMPQVQTCVLLIAIMYAFINTLLDFFYGLIDPRINMGKLQ